MDRKLLTNLKAYLEPSLSVPVILYDSNQDRVLPVIVLGTDKYEVHPFLDNNATVEGFTMVAYRGTQDPSNIADTTAKQVKDLLQDTDLYTTLNKPLTGTDTRPFSGFNLELLEITGMEKRDEEHSTTIFINWNAYISDSDSQ